jgi:hypothetical protein
VFRDVRGRRRGFPRCRRRRHGCETQDHRGQRLEHGERDGGRERSSRRTRFVTLRSGAAIIGRGLRHLHAGGAVLMTMLRTRTILAALAAGFGCRLPAGALRHGALCKCEHTDDRRNSLQEQSHTPRMGCGRPSVKCRPDCHARRTSRNALPTTANVTPISAAIAAQSDA